MGSFGGRECGIVDHACTSVGSPWHSAIAAVHTLVRGDPLVCRSLVVCSWVTIPHLILL